MQRTIKMPRLTRLANRNRNGGLRVILTTAFIVGSTVASFAIVVVAAAGL